MALADAGSSQSNTNCAVITETDQDQHSANLPSKEDTNHAVVRETDKRNEKLKSESNTTPAVIRKTDQHNELEGGQDETNSGKPHNDREPDVKEEIADDNSRDGTSVTENNNPPEKLTTLADLIHVCRERGLQVFNDKPNHPEADKLWLKTRNGIVRGHRPSGFTPSPPAHGFRHEHQSVRSGHTRSTRSRHSRRSRRSKKSSRREETSGAHCPDSVSTAHVNYGTEVSYNDSDINSAYHKATASRSVRRGAQAGSSGRRSSAITRHDTLTVGSACHRHSTGSRRETLTRTSVLSILELYDDNADIDAEEVLKLRMRRKSKRRKENTVTIVEMLQQKQKEIEALSPHRRTVADDNDDNEANRDVESPDMSKDNDTVSTSESRITNQQSLNLLSRRNSPKADITNSIQECDKAKDETSENTENNSQKISFENIALVHSPEKPNSDVNGTREQPVNTPTPALSNEIADTNTEYDNGQGRFNKTSLEESGSADHRQKVKSRMQEQTIYGQTHEVTDTTALLNGATEMPFNDPRISKPTGTSPQSTLSHTQALTPNGSLNGQKHEIVNEVTMIHQSQSVTAVCNDPIYDGNEIINEKIIVQRIMNEMNSRENCNNESISKGEITGNNDFLKNNNSNVSSSTGNDAQQDETLIIETTCTGNTLVGEEGIDSKFSNFDLRTEEKSCLEGLSKSQSDSRPSSGDRILNNSVDVKSDKKSHISNAGQQSAIDEHLNLQGDAVLETSANNTGTVETVSNKEKRDKGTNKKENASGGIELSVNERKEQKFTISLDADNLIAEKQILANENENSTLHNLISTTMETSYDDSDGKKNKDILPKKSYGNGFLVSADIHTSEVKISNSGGKNGSNAGQNERNLEGNESHSSVRQSVSSTSKSGSHSTSTSLAATPLRKAHGAARLMLMLAQLKKSYEDEEKTQQSFLQEIGSTRKTLRSNYRKMQLGEDIQIESPKHDSKSEHNNSAKNDEREVYVAISAIEDKESDRDDSDKLGKIDEDQGKDLDNDVQTDSGNEANLNKSQQNEENVSEQERVSHKVFSEPPSENKANLNEVQQNKENVSEQESVSHNFFSGPPSENIKNAKAKIDTHWHREGTVYKQIKTGFKSKLVIPDSSKVANELKKLKQTHFITGNVPAHNVYIEDARQRYKQSLQNQNQNNSQSKRVSRPKTERVIILKDEKLTVKPQTDGHRSQSPYPKKTAFEEKSMPNCEVTRQTNQNGGIPNGNIIRQTNQNVGVNSRIPVRTKPYERPIYMKQNKNDREFERLERDKKIISDYQEYMESKDILPNVEESDRKTFNTHTLTNNKHMNANSTNARKLKGKEFSTNSGYAGKDSPHMRQSSNKEKTSKHLENHRVFPVNEIVNKSVNGLDSRGESVQSHEEFSPKSTGSPRRCNIPIGKAVEIVQSRNKFYEDSAVDKSMPRELRVLKLFEQLQRLKYGQQPTRATPSVDSSASMETTSRPNTEMRKFLMMDYGLSDFLLKYRSNLELNRFLHEAVDYEICSRGRHLYKQHSRKERAFENLRQKFYPNSFSVSHQAR